MHTAVQVDGTSNLKVMGEIHFVFTRNECKLKFSGLVVNQMACQALGGTQFFKENDVYARMGLDEIVVRGKNTF